MKTAAPQLASVILLSLLAQACGDRNAAKPPAPKFPVTVEVSDNTFRNDYFGMTAKKPESWHALTPEQQEQLLGMGADLASSGNDDMKKILDVSAKRLHPLFAFFKHELGAPVPFNPNVLALAENTSFMPGMKTGKDYFYQSKKMMNQTGMNYEFGEQYSRTMIGGVAFDVMDVTLNFNGDSIQQKYYAARHGDHFISIVESYGADELKVETAAILDSIELNW